MRCKKILSGIGFIYLTLLSGISAQAQPASDSMNFTAEQLLTPPTHNWITNGGTVFNQRWSPLDKINKKNVAQLKGVWRIHLDGSGMDTRHSAEAQPLVYNGIIYTVTGDDDLFAVSVKTGAILWRYKAKFADGVGPSICCGWVSRGVGLGEGKVFVGQLDARLVALDAKTGNIVWQVQAAPWQEGYSITAAPLYYDGMVITSFAGAEYGVRGMVKAYDAKTGKALWTFHTIPGPGEKGHDTWPQNNNVWQHGGATVWQTPAVDPQLGLMYFSTGNAGPDFNGAVRKGDNLFSASIVALDVHTGKYRWHFQQVHHDLWDYDAPNPVILFDVKLNGKTRKALAEASKTGWVYILDRVTGKPLIGIKEKPVPQEPRQATAATQPHPIGDSFVPQFIDIAPEGVTLVNQGRIFTPPSPDNAVMMQPGIAGSANWPPSAYDPKRQIMYICAAETAMALKGGDPDMVIPATRDGKIFTGGGFAGVAKPQTGIIAAMDMTSNKIVWRHRWADTCYSGFVATAGDLLFVGRNDGRLTALDIDTAAQLWEFQTGAGMNSTVTVFEYEGKQYVLAYSGGNIFAGSAHGDNLWLFSLDGTLEQAIPGDSMQKSTGAAAAKSAIEMAADIPDYAKGKQVYERTCVPCHGEDGLGGHNGGAPLNKLTDIRQMVAVVSAGRNDMPTFSGMLTPKEIKDVSAYVTERLFK